jgi:YcaO-like protein with predicted kinase domain
MMGRLESAAMQVPLMSPFLGSDAPVRKAFQTGTHRLRSPAETVERVRPLMAAMGITRLANVTGLDSIGIPVAVAFRPNSRSVAVANGKGLDQAAAEASALMEAVESFHAERITLPLKLGSFAELGSSHRLIDVDALPRRRNGSYDADLPILWIEGHDLIQDEAVWLPYETVHTNYAVPLAQGSGCFVLSSNGLASGNHLLEAVSHAICEIVERDATALWDLSDEQARLRSRIDLSSVEDVSCRAVLAAYERAGVDVAVFETTSDTGVPAFLCTICEPEGSALGGLSGASGMGCHPDRKVALLRALTEAAQSRLVVIAGSRDDIFAEDYERLQGPEALRAFRARIDAGGPRRSLQHVPTWEAETFDDDIAWELGCLQQAGISRVVAVDLTRPELGLPVVRVVIPGLEYWPSAPNYTLGARGRARLGAGG